MSDQVMLPGRLVDKRYGITYRTRLRWKYSTDLNFPKPTVINKRDYYSESELDAWDREMAAKGRASSKSEVA